MNWGTMFGRWIIRYCHVGYKEKITIQCEKPLRLEKSTWGKVVWKNIWTNFTICMLSWHGSFLTFKWFDIFSANIPSPILFGQVIDTTCLLWKERCGKDGSCLMYDIEEFRYRYVGKLSNRAVKTQNRYVFRYRCVGRFLREV